jgi:hypothetical protein
MLYPLSYGSYVSLPSLAPYGVAVGQSREINFVCLQTIQQFMFPALHNPTAEHHLGATT